MTLGQRIRTLRQHREMTLQDVAKKTGYSKALISRIENDSVPPSIGSLMKIALALGTTLFELFAALESGRASVVKKNNRRSKTIAGGKIKVDALCESSAENKMAALIMSFEPGAAIKEKGEEGLGEQWWHILKGKLEAVIGDNKYELAEGDSMCVSLVEPREYRNPARRIASALVVSTRFSV